MRLIAAHFERPAVRFRNACCDRKAEARAARISASRCLQSNEWLKDFGHPVFRDAGAVVAHPNFDMVC